MISIAEIKTRQQYDDEYNYRKVYTEVECNDRKIMTKLNDYQIDDEFANKMRDAFEKFGSLTEKQRAVVNKKILQFEEILILLDVADDFNPDNAFIKSLDEYFLKFGYLSPKQIKSLKKIVFSCLE